MKITHDKTGSVYEVPAGTVIFAVKPDFRSIISRCITEIEKNNLDEHGWVRLPPDQKKVYDALVDWLFAPERD
jgi:hypothetical protein